MSTTAAAAPTAAQLPEMRALCRFRSSILEGREVTEEIQNQLLTSAQTVISAVKSVFAGTSKARLGAFLPQDRLPVAREHAVHQLLAVVEEGYHLLRQKERLSLWSTVPTPNRVAPDVEDLARSLPEGSAPFNAANYTALYLKLRALTQKMPIDPSLVEPLDQRFQNMLPREKNPVDAPRDANAADLICRRVEQGVLPFQDLLHCCADALPTYLFLDVIREILCSWTQEARQELAQSLSLELEPSTVHNIMAELSLKLTYCSSSGLSTCFYGGAQPPAEAQPREFQLYRSAAQTNLVDQLITGISNQMHKNPHAVLSDCLRKSFRASKIV